MSQQSARFVVRESYSLYSTSLHRIWDTADEVWIAAYASAELATAAARRMENAERDHARRMDEAAAAWIADEETAS